VGGSDYVNAVVVVVGDGSGASITTTIASGVIVDLNIIDGGTGYTWARAFIIPGNTAAVAQAMIAPVGGHGSNMIAELGATTILISSTIDSTIEPYVADGFEYRQIYLISSVQPNPGSRGNELLYLGPGHPDYVLNPENLNKASGKTGHLLFVNNTAATIYSSETEEVLKIALTL